MRSPVTRRGDRRRFTRDADERAIRDLISEWLSATAAAELSRLLGLMDVDVVFLTPGQPPLRGRERFVAGLVADPDGLVLVFGQCG